MIIWRLSGKGRLPRTVQRFAASCSRSSWGKRLWVGSAIVVLLGRARDILPRFACAGMPSAGLGDEVMSPQRILPRLLILSLLSLPALARAASDAGAGAAGVELKR